MSPLLVRVFDVDFYLSPPVANFDVTFSQFRGCATHQVPVIRVFGSTDVGKKICVHIHGVFPYFYIPYDGSEPATGLMYKIASNLDKAINISLGQASSNNQHIYKIVLVSGIPFYGYHSKSHQFFKVFLYNPMLIKRVNNLLFNESVLGNLYQPHETHLNFTLQFMIDYNLHGMSNMVLSQAKFRHGNESIGNGNFLDGTLAKVSTCELECDTLGEYILNRQEIASGNLAANPGIAALWEDEKQRRRNKNEDSQLPHYLSLSKTNVPPTESHELFKRALRERLSILSQDPDKNDFNLSVYPAECPRNKSLLNCSVVDFHSPFNSQSDMSYDSELDQTLTNDTLNLTVDEDVQDLLNVLKDLEKNVDVEEDSILSQVSKNEVEDVEEEHDMSIAIEAAEDLLNETMKFSQHFADVTIMDGIESSTSEVITERKMKVDNIPQLDGNCQELDVQGSVDNIPCVETQSDVFIKLKIEKSRCYSSINTIKKNILCTEENNNVSLDCIVKIPQVPNLQNRSWKEDRMNITPIDNIESRQSLVVQMRILDEDIKLEQLTIKYEDCQLKHKYSHVEKYLNMQLYQPKILESRKLNNEIIQALIDKEHDYFNADSIGERVTLKNADRRKKLVLESHLENPCELVVVGTKIHLPNIVRKKRDMPSLNNDSSDNSESFGLSTQICRWKTIKRQTQNNDFVEKEQVLKKSIIRQRFSRRSEQFQRNFYKKKLLVQKFCKEYEKTWNKLEKGFKPTFKLIPGYRPYVFEPIQKVVSIQTLKQTDTCIQFSSIISNHLNTLNSSYNNIEGENSNDCNLNATLEISNRNENIIFKDHNLKSASVKLGKLNFNSTTGELLPRKNQEKTQKTIKDKKQETKDVQKNNKEKVQKTNKVKKQETEVMHNTNKEQTQNTIECKNQETKDVNKTNKEKIQKTKDKKQETKDLQKEVPNAKSKNIPDKTPPVLRSIEEILQAQKMNESHFFSSLHSIMDHYTISENKILQSTDNSNDTTDSNRRNILFLDGTNDDSDEDDSKKKQNRSSKKQRAVYSSLPIFKSSLASGRSTPIGEKSDSKKKEETISAIKQHIPENMKKIKRRINFESSSHSDNKIGKDLQHKKNSIKSANHKKDPPNMVNKSSGTDAHPHINHEISVKKESNNFVNNENSTKGCKTINELDIKLESTTNEPSNSDLNVKIENIEDSNLNTEYCEEKDVELQSTANEPSNLDLNVKIENIEDSNLNTEYYDEKAKSPKKPQENPFVAQDCGLSTSELYDIINNYDPQEGTSKCYKTSGENKEHKDDGFYPTVSSNEDIAFSGNFECSPYNNEATPQAFSLAEDIPIQSSGSNSDMFSIEKEIKEKKHITSNNFVYYKPLYKPPTRMDVIQSLHEHGIPHIRPQEPFYSNAEDASGTMEIGYNLLKIKTLTSMDALDFESSFEGIEHYRKKNFPQPTTRGKKENPRYFHCPEGTCLLTPLKKPPTRKEVQDWLKQNSVHTKVIEKSEMKKSKIYFASSQDIYSDNDMSMDLSLTLSPCTPNTDVTLTNTPESHPASRNSISENCTDSDVSTPRSTRSSPVFGRSTRKKNRIKSGTPESNIDSDSSVKDCLNSDLTLTPRSSRSGKSSPVLTKPKRRKKLDRSMTLRKSALLSLSSEHSGAISAVSLNNTYGFQCSVQNYQDARASVKYEYLTILSMELHVNTRAELNPNPEYDPIQAIFYSISNDVEENSIKPRRCEGIFTINPPDHQSESKSAFLDGTGIPYDVKYANNELELLEEFTKFIIYWDPDILLGYEIQMLSWGYLIERCFRLGINIIPEISRVKDKHLKFNEKETGDLRVTGRVVLDLWRLLRHEIALQSYTIQSTVYEILQRRIPKYSFHDLTSWWSHKSSLFRHRTVEYYMTCVKCQLKILEQLDFVGRTSELARLFGIQFYEVLSRGSQFRVESMMLRLAKPLNYVAVSPSVQQRAKMKAPEYIALVLEPESKLYTDPVIVLDFQSLYPSIIIAYNYCFSTCAGRVESLGKNTPFEFGASNLKVSKERIKYLLKRNLLNFSPCGVAFVKKSVRDGIMPRMLREILDTRLMVKKSMKENKDDKVLQKVLHSRQLGLKLIANVTYGYTAANFSGRMPSVELGDSIVSKARETLQRTISLVDNNKEWGVRVVYGDTDSLFVHCPGKSRNEAFAIGEQIVEAVDKENPDPVKLKLEKVYQPCILQTKKRYVGYMYESPDQKVPSYDAKGIETVRRDGCPAVAKMLEKTLRILFETKDVSKVKEYCLKQFNKIIMGRIGIKDLTFAKEFRGLTGYRPGACVPALELAKRWVSVDKRAEPRRGERVPYVIINGPPGLPLIRSVRSPHELLKDPALRPNALYYITRVIIPPLNRCFNLIGADLHHWFLQMPRKQLHYLPTATSPTKRSTISQYFVSTLCAICGVQTQNGLCDTCRQKPQETVTILNERARQWEASYNNCKMICRACTQILDDPKCTSLDCPVLYRLNQTSRDLQQADHVRLLLAQYFDVF